MNDNSADSVCGVCIKKVTEKQSGIGCDVCENWYHCRCVKMSSEAFKMIKEMGEKLAWNCESCIGEVAQNKKKLREENEALRDENKRLKDANEELKQRLDEMENTIRNIKHTIKEEVLNEIRAEVAETKKQVIHELKAEEERKKRIINLVMYKVKESAEENGKDREEED